MNCEAAREALGVWLDREVAVSELRRIEEHLAQCSACSREKVRIERLEQALKSAFAARTSELAFEPFWNGVRKRLAEEVPWHRTVRERLAGAFVPRRLAWALPLIVIFAAGLFSVRQFFPAGSWTSGVANVTFVESIDAHGGNVALFRESETRTTVIWLFPDQEGEDEVSEDAGRSHKPF